MPRRRKTDHDPTEMLDDALIQLLDEVEAEFRVSVEYHTKRLTELKEALRARQEADRIQSGS
jgi:hypothetical protein